jgi:hypothetical protein
MVSIPDVKRAWIVGFALAFALTTSFALSQENPVPNCGGPNTEKLSPRQLKSLLRRTESIRSSPLANQQQLRGTMVLSIWVDASGTVACIQADGHPLILPAVIDSVSRWKFRPYIVKGKPMSVSGRLGLRFQANERTLKYRVVEAPSN